VRPCAYTVASLASRWECSEGVVRKLIARGDLSCFRIGTLIRISAAEVERFEWQTTPCNASEGDTPLSGERTESGEGEPFMPQIDRARKPRHAAYGKAATIHRGPWAG
jgi:excisionase family DNA binding protein